VDQMHHILHPDDERFDRIDIQLNERWKESELSGDEYRFSWSAHFIRKGEVILVLSASTLDWLLKGLQWRALTSGEDGRFDSAAWDRTRDKCDQPGCAEIPTIFYKRLKRFTKQGDELAPSSYLDGHEYRQFCDEHKTRGDCSRDDADHNYEAIDDPRPPPAPYQEVDTE